MIEVKNVYKGYRKEPVLKDVSLTVVQGEIHGLIGENSAGKTTLIKCMTGIYRTDSGEILYDGEPVFDNPKVKERIGYVADYNEYIGSNTIKQMVKMYQIFYSGFDCEKFNDYTEIFKLPVDKRVHSLSQGQKIMQQYPNQVFFPAVVISLLMIAFNMLSNGLRDAFDPTQRGV